MVYCLVYLRNEVNANNLEAKTIFKNVFFSKISHRIINVEKRKKIGNSDLFPFYNFKTDYHQEIIPKAAKVKNAAHTPP